MYFTRTIDGYGCTRCPSPAPYVGQRSFPGVAGIGVRGPARPVGDWCVEAVLRYRNGKRARVILEGSVKQERALFVAAELPAGSVFSHRGQQVEVLSIYAKPCRRQTLPLSGVPVLGATTVERWGRSTPRFYNLPRATYALGQTGSTCAEGVTSDTVMRPTQRVRVEVQGIVRGGYVPTMPSIQGMRYVSHSFRMLGAGDNPSEEKVAVTSEWALTSSLTPRQALSRVKNAAIAQGFEVFMRKIAVLCSNGWAAIYVSGPQRARTPTSAPAPEPETPPPQEVATESKVPLWAWVAGGIAAAAMGAAVISAMGPSKYGRY